MIKAIALDDEPPALKVIEAYCEMTEGISLVGPAPLPGPVRQNDTFPVIR